ncbi:MAG TPA: nitrate ABC transporter ATP-binding protein [Lachnospiraceae bacterium]|nr:nitrate ABC transporter ATP-binding protein [Lachnospiraceae bacterium]
MHELIVKGVEKSFGDKHVLKDINMTLNEGETISLLGVSGGGKTTLFNIIAGLDIPDAGTVTIDGESIVGQPGRVGYMLQKDLLLPHKTIIDNVSLPLILKGMKKKEAREVALPYFEIFGLSGYEKSRPDELSGGMRQRAALLRTYLFAGEVMLLDEPFSSLDTITRSSMHEWYLSVMEKMRIPAILITHDVDEAILLSDRVHILSRETDDPDVPTTITNVIEIKGRDKKDREYLLTNDFIDYKKTIVDLI